MEIDRGQLNIQTLHQCHTWTYVRLRRRRWCRATRDTHRWPVNAGLFFSPEKFPCIRKTLGTKSILRKVSRLYRRHHPDDQPDANFIHFDDVVKHLGECDDLNGNWRLEVLANRPFGNRRLNWNYFHLAIPKKRLARPKRKPEFPRLTFKIMRGKQKSRKETWQIEITPRLPQFAAKPRLRCARPHSHLRT